jgi:hypothetical protein
VRHLVQFILDLAVESNVQAEGTRVSQNGGSSGKLRVSSQTYCSESYKEI